MAISRAERRAERRPGIAEAFTPDEVEPALDLLELTELAWNDCYGGITPSDDLVNDMILLSNGTIVGLIAACRLAVTDWRDLKIAANDRRGSRD